MKKFLVAIALSSLVSVNAFAQGEWICKTDQAGFDRGYTVVYDATKNIADVYEMTFAGTALKANLTICTSEKLGGFDTSTTVTCHDGLWKDSNKAVLELGGFVPTIGAGEFFLDGPEEYALADTLNCQLNIGVHAANAK